MITRRGKPIEIDPNDYNIYYRHADNETDCKAFGYVPAAPLEKAVWPELEPFIFDQEAIGQAIKEKVGVLGEADVLKKELEVNQKELTSIIKDLKHRLANMPTKQEIIDQAQQIRKRIEESYERSPRGLLRTFFAGKNEEGKRRGVYLKKTKDGRYYFTIRRAFPFEGKAFTEGRELEIRNQCS